MSLGTSPNPLIRSTTPGLETSKHGCIVTEGDEGKTSRDGVYAGGDAVTGAATVSYTHLDVYKRQEEVVGLAALLQRLAGDDMVRVFHDEAALCLPEDLVPLQNFQHILIKITHIMIGQILVVYQIPLATGIFT